MGKLAELIYLSCRKIAPDIHLERASHTSISNLTTNRNCIFVDESGDLGLEATSKRSYYVIGFVFCKERYKLRLELRRFLRYLHDKNKYPLWLSELKFTLPHNWLMKFGYTRQQIEDEYSPQLPRIRAKTIEIINENCDGVFAAILDKTRAYPGHWTPERLGNFIFADSLVCDILPNLMLSHPPEIYYDSGRLNRASSSESFNRYILEKDGYYEYRGIKKYTGNISEIKEISSTVEPCIWAADLVAGAFYQKYANNDWTYANGFNCKKIGKGFKMYWQ